MHNAFQTFTQNTSRKVLIIVKFLSFYVMLLLPKGICIPLASIFTFGFNFDITGLVAAIVISYATVSAVLLIFIFTSNWTKICCRIISAYSGFTFVAVDEEKGHRRWQPSIDAAAVSKIESNSLGQDAEQTFGLKKELGLV